MSSRIWELSFILFFLSLHSVTHFRNHCHKCHPVIQKQVTSESKVKDLRRKSQGLTPCNPLVYEPQSNHKALKNQTSQAFRSDTKQGM